MNRLRHLIQVTHKHGVEIAQKIRELTRRLRGLEHLNAKRRAGLSLTKHSAQEGIDYTSLSPRRAKQLGISFVCRYLSHDPAKNLTLTETRLLSTLGISIVLIWETTANRALDGASAGAADAREALRQAYYCGMPRDRPIYFAVDFDADGPDIDLYFRGIGTILPSKQRGAYGGKKTISYLFDHGLIDFGWQTYAWSNRQWDRRAQIQQYNNTHPLYDRNRSTARDFGQWKIMPTGTKSNPSRLETETIARGKLP